MSDVIPFHIQEKIIKMVPVKALVQFRCVSKAWKSLIDSSEFIAAHSFTQPQHLLLKYEDPLESKEKYVSFLDDDTFPQQRFVHTLPLSVKLLIGSSIVGSSHGLLCLHGYYWEGKDFRPYLTTRMLLIWNPSIRKSISVAVPNKFNPEHEIELGFGVCPITIEPKIIEITQSSKTNYQVCGVWMMDHGVGKSFTKLFNIKAPHGPIKTLGFRNSGEPIMEVKDDVSGPGELAVYDPNLERFNALEISGKGDLFFVNSYVETLLLLGRSDCTSY